MRENNEHLFGRGLGVNIQGIMLFIAPTGRFILYVTYQENWAQL